MKRLFYYMFLFLIIKFKIYVNGSVAYRRCMVNNEYVFGVGDDNKIHVYTSWQKIFDGFENENEEIFNEYENKIIEIENEIEWKMENMEDGKKKDAEVKKKKEELELYKNLMTKLENEYERELNELNKKKYGDYYELDDDDYGMDGIYNSGVYLLSCSGENNLSNDENNLVWEKGCIKIKKDSFEKEYEIIIPYGEGCSEGYTAKKWENSAWVDYTAPKGCNPSSSNDDDLENCEGLYIYDNKLYECSKN